MSAAEYEVGCPMPDCDEPLTVTWFLSYGLAPADVALDPDPDVVDAAIVPVPDWHHSSTYEIGCVNGHVLVLPPDTAHDSYDLDAHAIERLRAVIAALASAVKP